MKIGLVGGSSQERSLPFNAEDTINLYPVSDPQGAEVSALYKTDGLSLFSTAGTGPIRGNFYAANGRAFVVSSNNLYELSSAGVATSRGSLDSSSTICTMEDNGSQLGICDGTYVYIFTYATNAFAKVTDPDIPIAGSIDFLDGYFIINEVDSGKFYISGLYDGLTWDALDFATAESSPDKLIKAANFVGQLGLFGAKTLEIWRNTGDSVFPFSRISGATQIGSIAPHTILNLDTSIFWVGANDQGSGIVYRAQGFTPMRISTNAIELILQRVAAPENLRAFSYQRDGHVFYCITGSDLETTLCYDVSTGLWHKRAYLNAAGELEQHLAVCSMFAFNKHLVGSRVDGKIYEISPDYYDDAGDEIQWTRIYTHLIDEGELVRYSTLKINLETGVGLQSGQGSTPVISLRVSKDGARTWSDYYTTEIGAVGDYGKEVNFRRLGISTQMTFELSGSDPVKIALIGSYLK